ncbi:putative flippase GtrA [Novosphingobium sp. PhB165]|uniref:GtrA family protein n=1 Tax=Novosphingobium sp. PhB165 TaxID=2485105 RepID=UPI0010DF192B|nr:GtrA family protein [Novosphingobium sp. PhB165]TCM21660.1 putative flippase GtrA [Novosphingobium sp. PhB165]
MRMLAEHPLVVRLMRDTFLRYLAASALALGVDIACFWLLVQLAVSAGPASAAGYSAGIVAHWLIASRVVFAGDVAEGGMARARQKALFVLSALAGLAITTGVVSAGAMFGMHLAITKALAIGLSFFTSWLIRRRIVFRRPAAFA